MDYVTTVRVLLRESRQPLANVKVALFDRDEKSADDKLGETLTNAFGEATFKYTSRDFADSPLGHDDGFKLLDSDTVPDLYAVVYGPAGQEVVNMREEATQNKAALNILVTVEQDVALANGLLNGA